jgi:hypothetical protein
MPFGFQVGVWDVPALGEYVEMRVPASIVAASLDFQEGRRGVYVALP